MNLDGLLLRALFHMYKRKDTDSEGKIITEPLQTENDKQMKELGYSDESYQ